MDAVDLGLAQERDLVLAELVDLGAGHAAELGRLQGLQRVARQLREHVAPEAGEAGARQGAHLGGGGEVL